MAIFLSAGHNMMTYLNTVIRSFALQSLVRLCGKYSPEVLKAAWTVF